MPEAFAIIGQPDLDTGHLASAKMLRALINVEGNFFPNVDYATEFSRGVRVLGCGSAYAQAVAEYSLGLAIDLARGISAQDAAMRQGEEMYVSESNRGAVLLHRASVGILGYGNLGRRLHRLIQPFHNQVRIYYPWLPPGRLYAAIDVWPTEPLPADSPFRKLSNVVLSPHRAGGITQAFHSIGDMVVDDLLLMERGLPPVRLQRAAPELVGAV